MRIAPATALALLLFGCGAGDPSAVGPLEPAGPTALPDGTPLLRVKMTGQTTDGGTMLMRGVLVNPHPEPVQGVRLLIAFLMPTGGDEYRIADLQRKELGATIPPGGQTIFRWDVESQQLAGPGRFSLVAIPKKLGEREIAPPPEWEQATQ